MKALRYIFKNFLTEVKEELAEFLEIVLEPDISFKQLKNEPYDKYEFDREDNKSLFVSLIYHIILSILFGERYKNLMKKCVVKSAYVMAQVVNGEQHHIYDEEIEILNGYVIKIQFDARSIF